MWLTPDVWVCVKSFKISDGFIRVFVMRLLLYLSFMKIVSVDTPCLLTVSTSSSTEKSTLQPCLLSMKWDVFSGLLPRFCFSLLTGLLSCEAVCTGPEDAIENNLIVLVGEGCLSTLSCVTILQLSDFVGKAFLTHSRFVLNSLSPSSEDLSDLVLSISVLYAFLQRGCNIPSCIVSEQGWMNEIKWCYKKM